MNSSYSLLLMSLRRIIKGIERSRYSRQSEVVSTLASEKVRRLPDALSLENKKNHSPSRKLKNPVDLVSTSKGSS